MAKSILETEIKVNGMTKTLAEFREMTALYEEQIALAKEFASEANLKVITAEYDKFNEELKEATINSKEFQDNFKDVAKNGLKDIGVLRSAFSSLGASLNPTGLRRSLADIGKEAGLTAKEGLVAGNSMADIVGNVAGTASSVAMAFGAWGLLLSVALQYVKPMFEWLTKISDEEQSKLDIQKKSVETQKQALALQGRVYQDLAKNLSTGLMALNKYRDAENKANKSSKDRLEVSKELVTVIAESVNMTEKEVQELLKAKDGYDILTEAMVRNAEARTKVTILQELAESRLRDMIELEGRRASGGSSSEYDRQLEAYMRQQGVYGSSNQQRVRRATDNFNAANPDLYAARNEWNEQNINLEKQLRVGENQFNQLLKMNDTSVSSDKTLQSIYTLMNQISEQGGLNRRPNSSSSTDEQIQFFNDKSTDELLSYINEPKNLLSINTRLSLLEEAERRVNKESEENRKRDAKAYKDMEELRKLQAENLELSRQRSSLAKEDALRPQPVNPSTDRINEIFEKLQGVGEGRSFRGLVMRDSAEETLKQLTKYIKGQYGFLVKNPDYQIAPDNVDLFKQIIKSINPSINIVEQVAYEDSFFMKDLINSSGIINTLEDLLASEPPKQVNNSKLIASLDKQIQSNSKLIESLSSSPRTSELIDLRTNREEQLRTTRETIKQDLATISQSLISQSTALVGDSKDLAILSIKEIQKAYTDELNESMRVRNKETLESLKQVNTATGFSLFGTSSDGLELTLNEDSLREAVNALSSDPTQYKLIIDALSLYDNNNASNNREMLDLTMNMVTKLNQVANEYGLRFTELTAFDYQELANQADNKELRNIVYPAEELAKQIVDSKGTKGFDTDEAITSINAIYNAAIDTVYEVGKLRLKADTEIAALEKQLIGLYASSNISAETTNDELKELVKLNGEGAAEARIILDRRLQLETRIVKANEEISSNMKQLEEARKRDLDSISTAPKDYAKILEQIQYFTDLTMSFGGSVFNLLDVMSQNLIESLNLSLQSIEDRINETVNRLSTLESELEMSQSGRREAVLQAIEIEKQREKDLAEEKIKLQNRILAEERKAAAKRKAWAITEALVNGALGITRIFATSSATNPISWITAGLLTATTAAQVATIASQKFAKGGYTGDGNKRDETGQRVAGIVHEGEYVIPKWMMKDSGVQSVVNNLEATRLAGRSSIQSFNENLSKGNNDYLVAQIATLTNAIYDISTRPVYTSVTEISNALNTKSRTSLETSL